MKYIGIDYGTKRIGIATSDDTGSMAFPLTTVQAGSGALEAVHNLIKEHKVEKIILGESKNFKNEPNDVMEDIEQFKKDLAEISQLPVEYEAEFLTSAMALRQAQGKQGEGGVKGLDASAAAIILQSYLDRQKREA